MTVSQPAELSFDQYVKSRQRTCDVTKEPLVRSWSKERNPVVLTAGCRNSTCKFSYTYEDREVAEPDDCKAVDETCRPATVVVRCFT
jgi:hypothetical protein